jgi:hypothetical protein
MTDPYVEWQIKPIRVLHKYFQDGTIEEWLTNDNNDELYLIKSYKHPSGKSPIVRIKPIYNVAGNFEILGEV